MTSGLFARIIFRVRHRVNVYATLNTAWLRLLGAQIGSKTRLNRCLVTWPHQLKVGRHCTIEPYVSFKFDGIYKSGPNILIGDGSFVGTGVEFNIRQGIQIGKNVLIASGCRFIDGSHGMNDLSLPMGAQIGEEKEIVLEDEVWLGVNVVVLKGVNIGRGAVVGAGAVVTKSIPTYEIWGGVPARKIGDRRKGTIS